MSADSWQRTGMPADRSHPSDRVARQGYGDEGVRGSRPVPPLPPRRRSTDREWGSDSDLRRVDRRGSYDDSDSFSRPTGSRYAGDSGRPARRPADPYAASRRPAGAGRAADPHAGSRRPADPYGDDPRGGEPRRSRAPQGADAATPSGGSRLRGSFAVLGVFLLTLAGAGADSFLGVGLGTITLVALALSSALATLLVRRRDLVSVLIAPPLVFVAVAAVDVGLAPSAKLSLATVATLLIRGFPAMGIATGLALVLGLIRLATRR